jgi:uncharacterized protein (TIGR02646 family)
MSSIRQIIPSRSAGVEQQAKYQSYKPLLRADFSERCGYCDAPDSFFGGLAGYHIDHFAPKSLFPARATDYFNLVYSCPYCNIAKSNKWIGVDSSVPNDGSSGFVDPCLPAFDDHFTRGRDGKILPTTQLGNYMLKHLKLYLMRHQLIWAVATLEQSKEAAKKLLARIPKEREQAKYIGLLELIVELDTAITEQRRLVFGNS